MSPVLTTSWSVSLISHRSRPERKHNGLCFKPLLRQASQSRLLLWTLLIYQAFKFQFFILIIAISSMKCQVRKLKSGGGYWTCPSAAAVRVFGGCKAGNALVFSKACVGITLCEGCKHLSATLLCTPETDKKRSFSMNIFSNLSVWRSVLRTGFQSPSLRCGVWAPRGWHYCWLSAVRPWQEALGQSDGWTGQQPVPPSREPPASGVN